MDNFEIVWTSKDGRFYIRQWGEARFKAMDSDPEDGGNFHLAEFKTLEEARNYFPKGA